MLLGRIFNFYKWEKWTSLSFRDHKKQFLKIPNNEVLILEDYYWPIDFYINNLEAVGFENYKIVEPTIEKINKRDLNAIEKTYDIKCWGSEKNKPPFIIFDVEK